MPRPNCSCISCPVRCSRGSAQPLKASNTIASRIERGLIHSFYEAPISLQEGCKSTRWNANWSSLAERAQSKDPATVPKSDATGFLDFAPNDNLLAASTLQRLN